MRGVGILPAVIAVGLLVLAALAVVVTRRRRAQLSSVDPDADPGAEAVGIDRDVALDAARAAPDTDQRVLRA